MRPVTVVVLALAVIALVALTTLPSGYAQPTVGITAQYLPATHRPTPNTMIGASRSGRRARRSAIIVYSRGWSTRR
jgi:hypothetical protein